MERMKISIRERGRSVRQRRHRPEKRREDWTETSTDGAVPAKKNGRRKECGRAAGTLLRRITGKLACFLGVGVIGVLAVPVGALILLISGIWALTSRAASWGTGRNSEE